MEDSSRYALSFTSGGLLSNEAAVLGPVYGEYRDWNRVRDRAVAENLLQTRTRSASVRTVREVIKRLSTLTDREVMMLTEVTAAERGHLMWAAACRRYEFIGEFAEEVLRERFLTLAGTVSHNDFDSFFRSKAIWHAELDDLSEMTTKKLRTELFRMMFEAGLTTKKGVIEPVLLSRRVADCLVNRTPSDLRFFPSRGEY